MLADAFSLLPIIYTKRFFTSFFLRFLGYFCIWDIYYSDFVKILTFLFATYNFATVKKRKLKTKTIVCHQKIIQINHAFINDYSRNEFRLLRYSEIIFNNFGPDFGLTTIDCDVVLTVLLIIKSKAASTDLLQLIILHMLFICIYLFYKIAELSYFFRVWKNAVVLPSLKASYLSQIKDHPYRRSAAEQF